MTGDFIAWALIIWSMVVGALALGLLIITLSVYTSSRLGSYLYRRCDCHQRLGRLLGRS